MLLNFQELVKKYNVKSNGVIVVGAHFGEEYNDYIAAGIRKIVFIEPCQKAFEELKRKFQYASNVKLFNLACGNKCEVNAVMYTGDHTINKGQSNSLLKPAKHLQIHPEVEFDAEELVAVDLLDNLGISDAAYDMLVMDAQGYEGLVLRGGINTLKGINWVYTEVNKDEVYEDNTMVDEMDAILSDFSRVETGRWVREMWSDAFYVRKTLLQ